MNTCQICTMPESRTLWGFQPRPGPACPLAEMLEPSRTQTFIYARITDEATAGDVESPFMVGFSLRITYRLRLTAILCTVQRSFV